MQLSRDGAEHFPAAFSPSQVSALQRLFGNLCGSVRLTAVPGLAELITPADAIARAALGSFAQSVAAKYFDKSPERNWSLGWHQDRTIAVRERRDVPGFTAWTVKSGIPHAVPPFELLERMLTVRIHLDDAGEDNAPLVVAPGSHRLGLLREPEIPAAVERCGTHACLALSRDVWLYAAPLLHASDRARSPARRGVLQLSYSADDLPGGLEWLGV